MGGENGVGPNEFSSSDGGGIDNTIGVLTVNNSTLSYNQAIGGNGSTPSIGSPADYDVLSAPATGSGQGGGMVNYAGLATVSNCTLIGNEAIGGNTAAGPGAIADGGGISNWGSALGLTQGYLTLTNSTLRGNEAIAGQGGGPASSTAVWGFAAGGGIDDAFSANATVDNCTLVGNRAIGSSGANGGTGFGGGISLGFSYLFNYAGETTPIADNSTLLLSNSTLQANVAQGGDGGVSGTGGDGLGGGLAINPGSSATVMNSTIASNRALGGGGGTSGKGLGGGVDYKGATFNQLLSAIDFNFASTSNFNIYP